MLDFYIENNHAKIAELRMLMKSLCTSELSYKGRTYVEKRIRLMQEELKEYETHRTKVST